MSPRIPRVIPGRKGTRLIQHARAPQHLMRVAVESASDSARHPSPLKGPGVRLGLPWRLWLRQLRLRLRLRHVQRLCLRGGRRGLWLRPRRLTARSLGGWRRACLAAGSGGSLLSPPLSG